MYSIGNLDEVCQLIPKQSAEIINHFLTITNYKALNSGEKRKLQNDISVICISAVGGMENENILEAHRKYADLHFILEGADLIAFRLISECKNVRQTYNEEADYILYDEVPLIILSVKASCFCFISPEYAHMALYGDCGHVRKLVFKIPIN